MKKFLLIIVGIILFAIIAFSGVINAFYDTRVGSTAPAAQAEEIEGEGEATLEEETIVEESEVSEPEEVVEPEAEEPVEEAEEAVVVEGETEESADVEEIADEEPATEETELLGDKLLAFVGLKDAVDKIGLDIVKKIGLGIVAVGSFFEAIIILNIFKKKQDKAPKAIKGPKPPKQKHSRKRNREIPIEGYRKPSLKEGIKF